MDDFGTIYKVLNTLRAAMDFEELDPASISAARLGITENRWRRLIAMLVENGYIEGVKAYTFFDQPEPHIEHIEHARITLKGLEYLNENSMMKKAAAAAKGIAEVGAAVASTIL